MPAAAVRQDIEALRLASALGVIWFHVGGVRGDIAYGGLMVFISLSMFLGGTPGASGLASLHKRARRLLLPWLLWCAVYGAFNFWVQRPVLDVQHGVALALLTGTSIHLWYLPIVFICLLALDALQQHAPRQTLAVTGAVLAAAGIAAAPQWRPGALALAEPLAQWAHAAPAVALGLFMRCADAMPRRSAMALMGGIVASAVWAAQASWVGPAYLVGALAAAAVLSGIVERLIAVDLRPVSACTLGVYLVHPLVVVALAPLALPAAAVLPLATFCIALGGIWALRRWLPRGAAWAT